MKKVIFPLLLLALFPAVARAGSSLDAYHAGDTMVSGCVAGAALGAVVGAADAIAERRPTAKLATMPGLGCLAFGVASGFGTAAMAEEAPKQEELRGDEASEE